MFRFVRSFWPYMRQHKLLISGSLFALVAQVGIRLLEPWPLKFVFDRLIAPSPGDELDRPIVWLTVMAVAVVLVAILRAVSSYASTIGFALVGNRVLTEVRADLYQHMQRLSLSYHDQARTGDLTIRVISDIGMLKDVTITALMPLVANVLILIGMLSVTFWLNWQLALLAASILPLFLLRSVRLSRRIGEVSRKQRRREGDVAATAAEAISAIRTVQALSLEKMFGSQFARHNNRSQKEAVKAKRLEARLERSVDVLTAVGSALVLWYGVRLVLQGALTAGELLVFLAYLKSSFRPIQSYAKYTGRLAKASAAGDRVLEVFEREPDIRDAPNAIAAPDLEGDIEFDNVTFAYEEGDPVLRNISFRIAPGQQVALVGPSGHGKSTLASLLLRLYDPTSGAIRIDGRDLREYKVDSLRRQMSVVLQDSLLFAASVRDNISYGQPDADATDIVASARLANAHLFIGDLPIGYETILGERGATLSGGQRQRIAIARAAIRQAPILVLDEPTAGLDEQNEQTVVEALKRLASRSTSLLITHDLAFASHADLILYIERGQIVERGAHLELMEAGGKYATLYTMQAIAHERGGDDVAAD